MESQHDLGGKLDEIDLQNLGHERETSGSARLHSMTLMAFSLARNWMLNGPEMLSAPAMARRVFGSCGRSPRKASAAGTGWWRPGMDTGIFNVLRDGVGKDFSIVGHSVELYLLAAGIELADDDRMLLDTSAAMTEEVTELLLVVADVHSGSGKHVRRSNQHREANLPDEIVHLVDGRELSPSRLVNPEVVHDAGEFVAVFGLVDVLGGGAENRNVCL